MDGSERRELVNTSLGWPGGIAVDTMCNRVYWTDERLKAIGSANLDGEDIQVESDLVSGLQSINKPHILNLP